jgi:tetratricopeptide (TPR) repeat protein
MQRIEDRVSHISSRQEDSANTARVDVLLRTFAARQSADTNRLFLVAADADRRGDYVRAVAAYDTLLTINPRSEPALLNRGVAKMRMRRPDDAIEDYRAALSLNPRYQLAWFNIARAYILRKDWGSADSALSQAIAIDPRYAQAYVRRATLRDEHLNRWQDAIDDYSSAIAIDTMNATYYYERAVTSYNHGLVQDAERDLTRSRSLDPKEPNTNSLLGRLYMRSGRGELAAIRFQEALQNPDGFINAIVLESTKRWLAELNTGK